MIDKVAELDTIKTEHEFMQVGDPVPVNMFDEHDLHIKEHEALKDTLKNENEEAYVQNFIDVLDAHIGLHKEMKQRI